MITYKLFSLYYARLQVGHGLNLVVFNGVGETREGAMLIALMKAYHAGLIK